MPTLVPNYVIQVGGAGYEIDTGIRRLIQTVEYESADGMADVMHIRAVNPGFQLSDSRLFAPGNEVSLWMGYGTDQLVHVGRVKIYKNMPTFPQDGWPTFEAVGYTKDHDMMHRQPEVSSRDRANGARGSQRGGRRFTQLKYSEAVAERAEDYGFELDIDDTHDEPSNFIQRAGMSDYDFIKGLSNLTGFYFWVDGDEQGTWTLHFKDPETFDSGQERIFTLEYNNGNFSTLFSFEPEFLITGAVTRIRARVRNARTGRIMEAEFTEDNLDAPDLAFEEESGGLGFDSVDLPEIESAPATSTAVQLFIGDYSFEDLTSRRFGTEAELINWARQWFRRQRENFILSRGVCIGVEDIMCRQVHTISGVGTVYDGDYFFSRVKHKMDGEGQGYTLDFNCRKQTPRVA